MEEQTLSKRDISIRNALQRKHKKQIIKSFVYGIGMGAIGMIIYLVAV